MKLFVVLILTCVFGSFEALKCELKKNNGDKIKNALAQCVKDKKIDAFWETENEENGSEENSSEEKTSEEKSSEETQNSTESTVNKSKSSTASKRSKRASGASKNKKMQDNTSSNDNGTSSDVKTEQTSENCVVQCVFSQMNLVDENGMPDQEKVLDEIVKSASNRELRNFLQDSVEQCYQDIKKGDNSDKCADSTKLIKCLADKGKENCADWPAGGLPI